MSKAPDNGSIQKSMGVSTIVLSDDNFYERTARLVQPPKYNFLVPKSRPFHFSFLLFGRRFDRCFVLSLSSI